MFDFIKFLQESFYGRRKTFFLAWYDFIPTIDVFALCIWRHAVPIKQNIFEQNPYKISSLLNNASFS